MGWVQPYRWVLFVSGNYSQGDVRQFDILLIEPDPDAISPFIDSFKATDATEEVHVVSDGDEALDSINRRGTYAEAPRPDLILLDLQVSGTSGERILQELNGKSELRRIPVIVFTSSGSAEDTARFYELNASAYVTKPDTSEGFVKLAQAIENFWLKQAHLPPK